MEFNIQNINAGGAASTDVIASADNVTANSAFVDMGITSSHWDGTQPLSLGTAAGVNDGYLLVAQNVQPNTGHLLLATSTTGSNIKFVVAAPNINNTVTSASVAMTVNPVATSSTNTLTGVLVVNGGAGIGGDLYLGGSVNLSQSANGTGLYINSSTSVYYSIQFNGTTDYLYNSTAPTFAVGANDFTIELWIYPTRSATETVISSYNNPGLEITLRSGTWTFDTRSGMQYTGGTYSVNQWTHIAVTRSNGTIHTFVNGTQINTYSVADSYTGAGFIIGALNNTPSQTFQGYLADITVVKYVALYTASFTKPAVPVTPTASTSLLTADSASIIDQSLNQYSIAVAGSPHVTTQTPYTLPENSGASWTYDGVSGWQTPSNIRVGNNLTVDGNLILVDKPTIYDQAGTYVDNVTTATLDSFNATIYRSAKYTVSISNKATNQFQTSEIWLVQDGTNSYIEETSVFSNGNLVAFSTVLTGTTVKLQVQGYNDGNIIKVQRTYITV
jgi:hypothetical protein